MANDPLNDPLAGPSRQALAAFANNRLGIDPSALIPPRPPSSGEVVFDQVVSAIQDFEGTLSAEEEIGTYLVNVPSAQVMHIEKVERRGREMIAFHGVNEHRKAMLLLQHCTQVNILLIALPKLHDTARRIWRMRWAGWTGG